MKKLFLLVAITATSMLRAAQASNSQEVIPLPPFRVVADPCTLNYTVVAGKVAIVEVSEVTATSKLSNAGLRPKDRLVSVDGELVKGMKKEAFEEALERAATPSRPKVFTFTAKRGPLGVRSKKIGNDGVFQRVKTPNSEGSTGP